MISALPRGGLDIAGNRAECSISGVGFGGFVSPPSGFGEPYGGRDGDGYGDGDGNTIYPPGGDGDGSGRGAMGVADGESNPVENPLCVL